MFDPRRPTLRYRLDKGETLGVVWLSLGSVALCELAARSRPDAIVLDMQHGLWDRLSMENAIGATPSDIPVMIRIAENTPLAIGQALVGLVPSTGAVTAIGRILFIVLVLLGIFGGTGLLGDTLKTIAQWSPVGALMTLFSSVVAGAAWSDQDTIGLLACAAYIVVFTFIGIRWFRWDSR